MNAADINIPLYVNEEAKSTYINNYLRITQESGRLMLFAGDQKVEHLNEDFYGEGISPENNNPQHMFEIASKARIGVFATQLGNISRYGRDYPTVPYLIKLNSKTNLVKTSQMDPQSKAWLGIGDVLEFKKTSGLNITGIGYTLYLGSEFESEMLEEAAKMIYAAQYHGLLTVLWIYPRGKAVAEEKRIDTIAGAAGVAACLGSDFVKVNPPSKTEVATSAVLLKIAVQAAGRTQLVCAGGASEDPKIFLQNLYDQIHIGGVSGNATGRNIHQKSLHEAIRFCNAISALTVDNKTVDEAFALFSQK